MALLQESSNAIGVDVVYCGRAKDTRRTTSVVSTASDDTRPSSRASTTSSRLTREEMSFASDDLDEFCKQIFALCDTNGDGYITKDELISQCDCDDLDLMDSLMKAMDLNNDGLISFEEFRLGLHSVSQKLNLDMSTFETTSSRRLEETVYENVSINGEKEEAWYSAMSRLDPHNCLSNNEEVCTMWMELYVKDHALLERFEGFLTTVVSDLEKSQSDVEHVQNKIKRLVSEHSREAHEMDGILQEQLTAAYNRQEKKSQEVSEKISTRYQELLEDREALIVNLSEKEQSLRTVLEEKTQTEQELRRERLELLNLNRSLKDQLTDSYKQLSASQRQLQRLSRTINDRESLPWLHGEDPLVETSIVSVTDSLQVSIPTRGSSASPQRLPSLSPPLTTHEPTGFPFNSPSLADEVEEAIRKAENTPTHSSRADTPIPITVDERTALLDNEEEGVVNNETMNNHSHHGNIGHQLKDINNSIQIIPALDDPHYPVHTPIHYLSIDHQPSFTVSQLIPPREHLLSSRSASNGAPTRVFKVVILGDSGVGKTSLVRRLTTGEFTIPRSTLGLDYTTSIINVGDENVVFQIWDTAGQERFHSTTAVYFRRADAFIMVYDVTNRTTFKSLKSWLSLVKATLRGDLPVLMFMGNKSDCNKDRRVTKEEGQQLALEFSALFSETSALSGDNVVQSHTTLASLLLERQNHDIDMIRRSALRLNKPQEKRCKC